MTWAEQFVEWAGASAPAPPPTLAEIAAISDPEQRGARFKDMIAVVAHEVPEPCAWNQVDTNDGHWCVVRALDCAHIGCRGGAIIHGVNDVYALSYVLVWNSTPESDGSRKCYALRIYPVWTNSVCAGIAYTFGRAGHGWYPKAET